MNTINPTTATEALRLAKTAERAMNLLTEGYTFFEDKSADYIAVCKPGRFAASYFISTYRGLTCDCPDFVKHNDYCKHTLCWEMEKETEAMLEDLCAKHDADMENAEGPNGCEPLRY